MVNMPNQKFSEMGQFMPAVHLYLLIQNPAFAVKSIIKMSIFLI